MENYEKGHEGNDQHPARGGHVEEDLYNCLSSDADEIITDNVSGAKATKTLLEERTLFDRMVDDVTDLFFG